jgi:hypothetical protein
VHLEGHITSLGVHLLRSGRRHLAQLGHRRTQKALPHALRPFSMFAECGNRFSIPELSERAGHRMSIVHKDDSGLAQVTTLEYRIGVYIGR